MSTAKPPISPTARAFMSSLLTAISAIPIGIWTGFLGEALVTSADFGAAIKILGARNGYVILGLFILIVQIGLQLRWDVRERDWQRRLNFWRTRRTLTFQKQNLTTFCRFIEKELGVPTSARVFEVRSEINSDSQKEMRLYQIRDLFFEREAFPQEMAFTYVRMDDMNFVSVVSILDRAPIFQILPSDHIDHYSSRERKMVEAKQSWVLSAPILTLTKSNRTSDELPPKGCIIFYGTEVPDATSAAIDEAKRMARDAAEVFSSSSLSEDDAEQAHI